MRKTQLFNSLLARPVIFKYVDFEMWASLYSCKTELKMGGGSHVFIVPFFNQKLFRGRKNAHVLHREDSTHGHHQMVDTEIRLIIFFAAKDGEVLHSQQKQERELTVAQIMNSLLPNSDLN